MYTALAISREEALEIIKKVKNEKLANILLYELIEFEEVDEIEVVDSYEEVQDEPEFTWYETWRQSQ